MKLFPCLVVLTCVACASPKVRGPAAADRSTPEASSSERVASPVEGLLATAKEYRLKGRWSDALSLLDEAERLSREGSGDRLREARSLVERGTTLVQKNRRQGGNFQDALTTLARAQRLARELGEDALWASAVDQSALSDFYLLVLRNKGSWDAVQGGFEQARDVRSKFGSPCELTESFFHVGLAKQMRGDRDASVADFEKALQIARECADGAAAAHVHRHLGFHFALKGDASRALEHYQTALSLVEASGNRSELAPALVAVGELLYSTGRDKPGAAEHFRRALALASELGDQAYIATAHENLATVSEDQGQHSEAIEHLRNALAAAVQAGDGEQIEALRLRFEQLDPVKE